MTSLPPGPRLPAIVQGLWFVTKPVEYFDRCLPADVCAVSVP